MQRRGPQSDWEHPPPNSKNDDEYRGDDKCRDADHQNSGQAARVILPMAAPGGRKKSQRQSNSHRKAKREQAEACRDGKRLGDDIIYSVVAVLERYAQIAVPQGTDKAQILPPPRLIQVI